jgi:hypothetical protein
LQRLNYGLALAHNGNFDVVDTVHSPGVRDDWSLILSEPFTYFVAPHNVVDDALSIAHLKDNFYLAQRSAAIKFKKDLIKNIILAYHGVNLTPKKPSWAD